MICTEYMARGNGSFFVGGLLVGQAHNVGMINWGLVRGKHKRTCRGIHGSVRTSIANRRSGFTKCFAPMAGRIFRKKSSLLNG